MAAKLSKAAHTPGLLLSPVCGLAGVGDVAPTFGRYTAEADEEEAERSAAMIRDLMRYDRDTLSQSQKKTYDLLLWTLQSAVPAAPMYYENPNAPNYGRQAQIHIS